MEARLQLLNVSIPTGKHLLSTNDVLNVREKPTFEFREFIGGGK